MTRAASIDKTVLVSGRDVDVRAAWRELTDVRLPSAALHRYPKWPVSENHCFARILLDSAAGCPWRSVIAPPAWKNADVCLLIRAIALGEAVLDGTGCLSDLNRKSLAMRGKSR